MVGCLLNVVYMTSILFDFYTKCSNISNIYFVILDKKKPCGDHSTIGLEAYPASGATFHTYTPCSPPQKFPTPNEEKRAITRINKSTKVLQ